MIYMFSPPSLTKVLKLCVFQFIATSIEKDLCMCPGLNTHEEAAFVWARLTKATIILISSERDQVLSEPSSELCGVDEELR